MPGRVHPVIRAARLLAWLAGSAGWLLALPYALVVVVVVGRAGRRPRSQGGMRQRGGRMITSGSSGTPRPRP